MDSFLYRRDYYGADCCIFLETGKSIDRRGHASTRASTRSCIYYKRLCKGNCKQLPFTSRPPSVGTEKLLGCVSFNKLQCFVRRSDNGI